LIASWRCAAIAAVGAVEKSRWLSRLARPRLLFRDDDLVAIRVSARRQIPVTSFRQFNAPRMIVLRAQ
jgi:hypothetical protein